MVAQARQRGTRGGHSGQRHGAAGESRRQRGPRDAGHQREGRRTARGRAARRPGASSQVNIVSAHTRVALIVLLVGAMCGVDGRAQRGGPPAAARSPQQAAPVDLTGYWVSLVTEDWRYRIVTPPQGDYTSVPLNAAGRKGADAWDPARHAAAGDQCHGFGVAGVRRLPGRLHITWQDDRPLRVEADAGTQVRTLVFGAPAAAGPADWQGSSRATWDRPEGPMGGGQIFGGGGFGSGRAAGA